MAGGASEQHAGSEDSLRPCAAFLRETAGNHGLRRRRVCSFAKPNKRSGDQEKKKIGGQSAYERRHAPANDANRNDGLAAIAVGQESKRDAAHRENHQEKSLQRTELGIRDVEMIAQRRNQRNEDLPRREVDKID